MKRFLIIKEKFSAAHLYKNDDFTEAENKKHFGRCYTKHGHGHNYLLETAFQIPSKTSDKDLLKIKNLLHKKLFAITDKLDHSHLNFDIPYFKKNIPTTENIALYFDQSIAKLKLKYSLHFIRLYEAEDLFSEITYE